MIKLKIRLGACITQTTIWDLQLQTCFYPIVFDFALLLDFFTVSSKLRNAHQFPVVEVNNNKKKKKD